MKNFRHYLLFLSLVTIITIKNIHAHNFHSFNCAETLNLQRRERPSGQELSSARTREFLKATCARARAFRAKHKPQR